MLALKKKKKKKEKEKKRKEKKRKGKKKRILQLQKPGNLWVPKSSNGRNGAQGNLLYRNVASGKTQGHRENKGRKKESLTHLPLW